MAEEEKEEEAKIEYKIDNTAVNPEGLLVYATIQVVDPEGKVVTSFQKTYQFADVIDRDDIEEAIKSDVERLGRLRKVSEELKKK